MRNERAYADFDVVIEPAGETGYRARVLDSPAGQADGTFTLPFSDLELENFLLKVGRPRRGTRRLESPEMGAARSFGGRLYGALFHDELQLCLRRSIDEVERRNEGLRIRLRLGDAPELATLPWEYLFNESGDRFLVLSAWTPIVRYVDLAQRIEPLTVSGPLRILALISSPRDYPTLDVEAEWERVESSLAELVGRGVVGIDRIEDATLLELQRRLRQGEYHVFHFVGHGGFDEAAGDGVLVFEDGQGRSRKVSGGDLGTILHDHRSLRLAVLNACEGARSSTTDPFSGTAQSLVRQGLPAVVAMQFEITDDAAITFAHEFYASVVDGYPVDAAIGEARRAIFGLGNDIEWGTPVLYMRTDDGKLFDVAALTAVPDVATDAASDVSPMPGAAAPAASTTGAAIVPEHSTDATATSLGDAAVPPVEVAGEGGDQPQQTGIQRETGDPAASGRQAAVLPVEMPPAAERPEAEEPEKQPAPASPARAATEPGTASARGGDGRSETSTATAPPTADATPPAGPDSEPAGGLQRRRGPAGIPVVGWIGIAAVVLIVALVAAGAIGGGEPGESTTSSSLDTTTSSGPPVTVVAPDATATAFFTDVPKTIDGQATDWTEAVVHRTPHEIFTHPRIEDGTVARDGDDASATVRLAWDQNFLYVLADVEDDVLSNPNAGNQIWHGDAVDLNVAVVGAEGDVSARPGADDHQITLSPGDPAAATGPGSVRFVGNGNSFSDNFVDVAAVASTIRSDGYLLEARIPWSELGVSDPTAIGLRVLIAVFDNDGEVGEFVAGRTGTLQTVILANTPQAGFQEPATWGTLQLTEE